jgi:hypothetical protein
MPTIINPSDQTITQYNIQTGGASNLLNNVAPSATSGVPVISQGAASQPVFGTAVVAGGGTGRTSLTNHGVLVGATTSAITQLAAGSAGQVLQSGGASADPAYSTATYPSTAGSSGNFLKSDGTNWSSAALPTATNFSAHLSGNTTNSTGDSTNFSIICDTVDFDNGSNYNSGTGVFTIPVTGIYFFGARVSYYNLSVAFTQVFGYINVGLGTLFYMYESNPGSINAVGDSGTLTTTYHFIGSFTATTQIGLAAQVGGSTKTIGFRGGAAGGASTTQFWGFRLS